MNILFIIGNGFDINCGLNTKYSDAYKEYCKLESNKPLLEKFKKRLKENYKTWGDFEVGMADDANFFSDEGEMKECVRDFSAFLKKYLRNEEKSFRDYYNISNIRDNMKSEMKKSVDSFYEGCTNNVTNQIKNILNRGDVKVDALSFNYTNVFDELFTDYLSTRDKQYISSTVVHIHGNINDEITMGVDRLEDIKAKYLISERGKRSFIKPIMNAHYDTSRIENAVELIDEANIICVFGASLSMSDLSWRNKLIEWLKNDISNQVFLYNKESRNLTFRTADERMDIEDDKKMELLLEWEIEDFEKIKEQIHIPCGRKIFEISKVIEKYKTDEENRKKIPHFSGPTRNRPLENGVSVMKLPINTK